MKKLLHMVLSLALLLNCAIGKLGIGSGKLSEPLKADWYYTWYVYPIADVKAEFVPMFWDYESVTAEHIALVKDLKAQGKVTHLMGFNEPEVSDQANNSVDQAIEVWPKLEAIGLRMVSPSVGLSNTGLTWLDEFMAKADEKKLKVDVVAMHWYGDFSKPAAPQEMMRWLEYVHKRYKKPIWLTEFAGHNWEFVNEKITPETNKRFMKHAIPLLEASEFVERYAWFHDYPEAYLAKGEKLTKLGETYRDRAK